VTASVLDSLDARAIAITQRVAFAGVLAMLVVAFVTTADVLLRWLFNAPIDGLNEIVGLGMAVAVSATFPAGAAQRVNLTIDVLKERVSRDVVACLRFSASFYCWSSMSSCRGASASMP
jgi:TRAP-type C4-dicarboxylate transport system permease small subunit